MQDRGERLLVKPCKPQVVVQATIVGVKDIHKTLAIKLLECGQTPLAVYIFPVRSIGMFIGKGRISLIYCSEGVGVCRGEAAELVFLL